MESSKGISIRVIIEGIIYIQLGLWLTLELKYLEIPRSARNDKGVLWITLELKYPTLLKPLTLTPWILDPV